MRNGNACPKCDCRQIYCIPGSGAGGRCIQYGLTVFNPIYISHYVCGKCGFVEEWVDIPDELKRVQKVFDQIQINEARDDYEDVGDDDIGAG